MPTPDCRGKNCLATCEYCPSGARVDEAGVSVMIDSLKRSRTLTEYGIPKSLYALLLRHALRAGWWSLSNAASREARQDVSCSVHIFRPASHMLFSFSITDIRCPTTYNACNTNVLHYCTKLSAFLHHSPGLCV